MSNLHSERRLTRVSSIDRDQKGFPSDYEKGDMKVSSPARDMLVAFVELSKSFFLPNPWSLAHCARDLL